MKQYPNGYLITLSDCVEHTQEEAYHEWYEKVMIPKIQELDFIGNASRYANVLPETTYGGHPKFLTLYEVWTENMSDAIDELAKKSAELESEGKMFSGHLPVYHTVYERMCEPNIDEEKMNRGPVQGMYVVFCFCNDPAKEELFNRWYNGTHVVQILDRGLWNSGIRCKLVDLDKQSHHQPEYLSLYETTGDPLEARNGMIEQRSELMKDIVWTDVLGIYFTGSYLHLMTAEKAEL